MSEEKYDLVVIGSGPGGYVASIVAAQKGMKVASIEKRTTLGGTCLNVGCIPSKAMLHASEQYENAVKLNGNKEWGITCKDVKLDLTKLLKKKSGIVDELTKGIDFLYKKNKVTKYIGTAKFITANSIEITGDNTRNLIHAENIIIATGSEATHLPNINIDEKKIVYLTKVFTFFWGICAIIIACVAFLADNLIQLVNIIGSIFYGNVLGIFLLALFTKKIRSLSVFASAIITQIAIIYIWWIDIIPFLWLNILGCFLVTALSGLIELFLSISNFSSSE